MVTAVHNIFVHTAHTHLLYALVTLYHSFCVQTYYTPHKYIEKSNSYENTLPVPLFSEEIHQQEVYSMFAKGT